jgi:hypothetical protein
VDHVFSSSVFFGAVVMILRQHDVFCVCVCSVVTYLIGPSSPRVMMIPIL